jgi:hypothetical protein
MMARVAWVIGGSVCVAVAALLVSQLALLHSLPPLPPSQAPACALQQVKHVRIMSLQLLDEWKDEIKSLQAGQQQRQPNAKHSDRDDKAFDKQFEYEEQLLEQEILQHVTSLPYPVVIRSLPSVQSSGAFKRWNMRYFQRHQSHIDHVLSAPSSLNKLHENNNNLNNNNLNNNNLNNNNNITHCHTLYDTTNRRDVFYYIDKRKPLYRHISMRSKDKQALLAHYTTHSRLAFDAFANSTDATYYSSSIADMLTGATTRAKSNVQHRYLQDMEPLQSMLPKSIVNTNNATSIRQALADNFNIWIGTRGVTSRLHFDASDNLYTQLSGYKRFVLFPPEVHHLLYVRPSLHPASRQSLVPLENAFDIADQCMCSCALPSQRAYSNHHRHDNVLGL